MGISRCICYPQQSSYASILSSEKRSMEPAAHPGQNCPVRVLPIQVYRTHHPQNGCGCSGSAAFVTVVHTSLWKAYLRRGTRAQTPAGFIPRALSVVTGSQTIEEFCSKPRLCSVSLSSSALWIVTRLKVYVPHFYPRLSLQDTDAPR